MIYRWTERLGELELEIEAATELDVFQAALDAFTELVGDDWTGEPTRHAIDLDAPTRARLLRDWLEELRYLAEAEEFAPQRGEDLVLREDSLTAVVSGRRGTFPLVIRAVTDRNLSFEQAGGGWRARVVFDV